MNEIEEYRGIRNPILSILVTLLLVFLGFQIIGPTAGMMVSFPFFEGSIKEFETMMKDPFKHPEAKQTLLLMQGMGTLFGMIVIPALLLRRQRRSLPMLFRARWYAQPVLLVVILVIVFMGVNSVIIEWNQNISFPGDDVLRSLEEKLAEGVKMLTQFNTTSDFVLAFVVIAILPALGEEIVFRGIIQNEVRRSSGNIHVAVWVTAIMFSAFHLQFFGFVPRMLLGAMFGYLYFWSGNLWIAVIAHFVNNGFMVVAFFLYQKKIIDVDMENSSSVPWQAVAFSAIFSILLLYTFKTFYERNLRQELPD
jgi:uncharacterized protein